LAITLLSIGILLIFLGFALAILAIILIILRQPAKGKVRGGAVIFIGPIPIIFGTDKRIAALALIFAVSILAIMLAWYLIHRW